MKTLTMFVTVGTDHHPFDRLVGWADSWAGAHPGTTVLVQFGTSAPPQVANGVEALPHEDMLRYMRSAEVVVTQGGPGGIMDSRICGKLPIVVPRHPALGEHVDDHQLRFAAHMLAKGRLVLAQERDQFDLTVARARTHRDEFLVSAENSPTARTAAMVQETLLGLVPEPRRQFWKRRHTGLRSEAGDQIGQLQPTVE